MSKDKFYSYIDHCIDFGREIPVVDASEKLNIALEIIAKYPDLVTLDDLGPIIEVVDKDELRKKYE